MMARRLTMYTAAAALACLLIISLLVNAGLQWLGNSADAAGDYSVKLGFYYNDPSDGTSAATIAKRTDFIISSNTRWRDELRANGYNGTLLRYFLSNEVEGPGPYKNSSASCDSSHDPLGNQAAYNQGDFCRYIHPNESWFLHNGRGERLVSSWYDNRPTYHMNPGNADWRAFARSRFAPKIEGFTGLYLDNVELNLYKLQRQIDNSDGVVKEYSSDDAFRNAVVGYLAQMNSLPGVVWGNLVNDDRKGSQWDLYMTQLDGALQEAWGNGYQPMTPTQWDANMRQTEKVLAQGKGVMMGGHGEKSNTQMQQFTTASYLLVTNGQQAYFRYSRSAYYRQWWYFSNYDVKLGAPKGPRYQTGTQWRRDFACGYVTVDPAARTGKIVQQSCADSPSPTAAPPTAVPPTAVPPTPIPAPVAPIALPGRIEAESYKAGGPGVGYNDATAGNDGGAYRQDDVDIQGCADSASCFNIGWIRAGEWLAYDVNVGATGYYSFKPRVASPNSDRSFHIEVDGVDVTGRIVVPNTGGWQTWATLTTPSIALSAGAHTVRFVADADAFNLNALDVVAGAAPSPTAAPPTAAPPTAVPPTAVPTSQPTALPTAEPTAVPTAVPTPEPTAPAPPAPATGVLPLPGRIEVEDYKAGGAGVGYYDTTGGNSGGAYRQEDVDIQECADGPDCHSVGWIMPGEWLGYDVNVASDGAYVFNVRASAMDKGRSIHIEIDGVDVTGPLAMERTGAWQTWATVSTSPVPLSAGGHTMRVVMHDHGINLNTIDVVRQ